MLHHMLKALFLSACLVCATVANAKTTLIELKIGGMIALGDLVVPEDGALKDSAVLITHGTLAHKDMELVESLQALLAERGIASLAHSLTFSQDRRTGMYDCAKPHMHAHEDAVVEIAAWADWLKTRGVKNISVLGHSRGGNQVAWFAAEKGGMEKVVLLAPALGLSGRVAAAIFKRRHGADILPHLKKASALKAQGKGDTLLDVPGFIYCKKGKATARAISSYYGEDARRNAIANIGKINVPVLVIAGTKDTAVPDVPKRIKPIADGKKVQLKMIEDADHMFLDFFVEDAADTIAEFLKKAE